MGCFPDAITYYLDVSVDNAFTKCIPSYHNRMLETGTTLPRGLLENTRITLVTARHPGGMTTQTQWSLLPTQIPTILPLTVGVKSVEFCSGENDWFKFKSSNLAERIPFKHLAIPIRISNFLKVTKNNHQL